MKIINMFQISNLSRGTLIRIDDIAENMNWRLMDKCEKLFHKYKMIPNGSNINQKQVIE